MDYHYEIILGALLHDIGKLFQKGTGAEIDGISTKGNHPIVSSNFIESNRKLLDSLGFDTDAVKEIVQRHHSNGRLPEECLVQEANPKYKALCDVVDKADNISSGERLNIKGRIQNGGNYQTRALSSIFSTLSSEKKLIGQPIGYYKDVAHKISSAHIKNDTKQNTAFITSFSKEFRQIRARDKLDFINQVDELLERYTWCFPSDSMELLADVSLYDHLKTTAAVASIIYSVTSRKLGLLKVTLHNIEDYVLLNGVENTQEIITTLRDNLSKLLSEVLSVCKLTNCNIITKSEYEFCVIVNPIYEEQLARLAKAKNLEIAQQTKLKVYLKSSYKIMTLSNNGLGDTSTVLKELDTDLHKPLPAKKSTQSLEIGLSDILTQDGEWVDTLYFSKQHSGDSQKQSEASDRVYYVIRVSVNNLEKIIESLFKVDIGFIQSWIIEDEDTESDHIKYGINSSYATISRVSTIYRTINKLLNIATWIPDATVVGRTNTSLVAIMPLDFADKKLYNYIRIMQLATANGFNIKVSIKTIRKGDRGLAENWVEYIQLRANDTSNYQITYNGIPIELDILNGQISKIFRCIKANSENRALLHRLYSYTHQYVEQLLGRSTEIPLYISRYFYDRRRNYKNVDEQLIKYLDEQFSRILNNKSVDSVFNILDTIISDVLYITKEET